MRTNPKGFTLLLGVALGAVVIGVIVGGALLFRNQTTTTANTSNVNAALNLACTTDADCSSYCGGDACYQPMCGATTIGTTGSCICRSLCGPSATTNSNGNTKSGANVNTSTNANTNTSVSTAGWKTYTNSDAKVSFKYPTTFSVQTNDGVKGSVSLYLQGSQGFKGDSLRVLTVPNVSGSSVEEVYANLKKSLPTDYFATASVTDISNGKVIYRLESNPIGKYPFTYIVAPTQVLQLSYQNDVGKAALTDTVVLLKQVAATFTFLDETAGWKTYTDSKLGFSIKFPPEWGGYKASSLDNTSIKFTHSKKVSDKGNPGEVSFIITRSDKGSISPMGSSFIKANNLYTFAYAPSNAAAPDELATYWEQIPAIISTFTFLDETVGWKTYTNEVLDFSIQYPPTWKIKEENRNNEKWVTIYDDIIKTGNFGSPQIIVQEKADLYPKDNCLLGTKQLTVAGITRTQQTEGCGYAGSGITTFFSKSTGYLAVTWTTDWENYSAEYNQILSTFTFTK